MYSNFLILSLSFFCFASFSNAQSPFAKTVNMEKAPENHPVKELYFISIDAFNAGKLELFLANFSSDITMYGTDGTYQGKEALRERFKVVFEQLPNKKMEIPAFSLEVLSPETVLVHFQWKLYPMGQGPAYHGKGSGLYVLKGDVWEEVLEVETVTAIDEALQQRN